MGSEVDVGICGSGRVWKFIFYFLNKNQNYYLKVRMEECQGFGKREQSCPGGWESVLTEGSRCDCIYFMLMKSTCDQFSTTEYCSPCSVVGVHTCWKRQSCI